MTHGWHSVQLGELLKPVSRPEMVRSDQVYRLLGAHWYAGGLYVKDRKPGAQIQAQRLYRVQAGDFVYNRLFGWKGSFAVAQEADSGCYVSGEFPCFECDRQRLEPTYLWRYFSRSAVWQEALGLSTGSTPTSRNRLKEEQLLAMAIPLPPLDEQRRILARIEVLAARIGEARGLRQGAVIGASALRQAGTLKVFATTRHFDMLPVGAIGEVKGGIQKSSARLPGGNPRRYITVAHVQLNHIDTGDPRFFEVSDAELERWRLLPGDVLVIEGNGSADQVGRTALFRGEIADCVHQNHVIRIRPNRRIVDPEYLNAFLSSPLGRDRMLERSRTTSGLFNLSVGRIESIQVPVPDLEQQRQVIAGVEVLETKLDALAQHQSETAAELDALVPSILDRAFRGELL